MASSSGGPEVRVAACLKWVDLRPEIDALTGRVRTQGRNHGASAADRAALEWALRLGELWHAEVVAVTAGPVAAEAMLREAVAAGATRAVRVQAAPGAPSHAVALALAGAVGEVAVAVCGDWSADRGSGSVPAFLAAELGAAQALGCTTVEPGAPGELRADRRLDGGRRERLRLAAPAVISVEAASARLRRAPLDGVLAARMAGIAVMSGPAPAQHAVTPVSSGPLRPRARVLAAPPATLDARGRVLLLSGALRERTPPRTLTLAPEAAADLLLAQLRTWGYLP